MTDIQTHPTDGPVHEWFGLSYSNYQVIPRTLMQSMPIEWQERMVACLTELRDAFDHIPQAEAYQVQAATEHIVNEMTDEELSQAVPGIYRSYEPDEHPPMTPWQEGFTEWMETHRKTEPTYYQDAVGEVDPNERVLLLTEDPVPHYNRGRTYIPPQTSA